MIIKAQIVNFCSKMGFEINILINLKMLCINCFVITGLIFIFKRNSTGIRFKFVNGFSSVHIETVTKTNI